MHDKLTASGLQIELAGWVPADNMPGHWAKARIACVPSKRASSGDADGRVANLAKMLKDRAATTAMGKAGRAFALADFNLQKQSVKLEDHLLRIAGLPTEI